MWSILGGAPAHLTTLTWSVISCGKLEQQVVGEKVEMSQDCLGGGYHRVGHKILLPHGVVRIKFRTHNEIIGVYEGGGNKPIST